MRFSYEFSNLCGTVYRGGNLVFTPDGSSVFSPVGNRVSCFDLINNRSQTFPFENRNNVVRAVLSPAGNIMLLIDEEGRALLISTRRQVVLHHHSFNAKVRWAAFSHDGNYLAVTHDRQTQIWHTPSVTAKEFAPFRLIRTYTGHFDDTTHVEWSHDDTYFVSSSKDMSARIYTREPTEGFVPIALTGHRAQLVASYFSKDDNEIYSVSRDGGCFSWEKDDEGMFNIRDKNYFKHNHAKITCSAYHSPSGLLVAGMSSGTFALHQMPYFEVVQTLSIAQHPISSVAINPSGEWLAVGSAELGQLLVWEWQSETYVLKQQGHFFDTNCVTYSPDGQTLCTGGDDGKVKLWSTSSGFCYTTFDEHTAPVVAVVVANTGKCVVSASLDGSVRAFDLIRYRNFRTMTTPNPVQFTSLAVDPSGEVVCAGALEPFEVYLWSLQTGKLLDVLTGHEAPISGLAFSPMQSTLASISWDKTCRLWDVFAGTGKQAQTLDEPMAHESDVLALAYRADGRQLCTATLAGLLCFWNLATFNQEGTIEGRRDIAGGRKAKDLISAQNSSASKHFTSVVYSADGSCVLAGGESKFVCIYAVAAGLLLKKFQISMNRSLDGVLDMLNSKNIVDGDAMDLIDNSDDDSDRDLAPPQREDLPGVTAGQFAKRSTRLAVRTKAVAFSPTGHAWAAASTEGLLVYSLDTALVFDPTDLDIEVTPESINTALQNEQYARALLLAIRLNERKLVGKVLDSTPVQQVKLVTQSVPTMHLARLLRFLAEFAKETVRIEFYMVWIRHLLNSHSNHLDLNTDLYLTPLRALFQSISQHHDDLTKVCDSTTFSLAFITASNPEPEAIAPFEENADDSSKKTKSKRNKR